MNNTDVLFNEDKTLPWVVFKVNNCSYAINTDIIIAILNLPHVTKIPNSPDYIKGIINLRGEILPLVDLRILFNFKSLEDEYNEFKTTIDIRKQEHINWVYELEKSIDQKTEFKLTTDPHQCKLGKWLDNFITTNNVINFRLSKLDESHKQLHSMANLWKDQKLKKEEFNGNLEQLRNRILSLLDNAKEDFKYYYKQMAISIRNEVMNVAIVVDEVVSVEHLECSYDYNNANNIYKSKFICGTADNGKDDDLILLINNDALTEALEKANINIEDIEQ